VIVVAGESLVDLLVNEAGEVAARLGGGPFNVARGLGRLESPCAFLGAISGDRFGRELRDALIADGVDGRCVVATERPTTLALANLQGGSATYTFYTAETAAPSLTPDAVAAVLPARVDALHVGTLGLVLEPIGTAIEQLVERADPATLVMVDPNCRPGVAPDEAASRARLDRVLARADVVKVSTEDLEYLDPGVPPGEAARALVAGRTRCVLVTDGARPVRVLTAAGEQQVPSVRVEVADTVGAGDAFCAGFLSAWMRAGRPVEALTDPAATLEAAAFAALVAASTCRRSGADPPRLDELDQATALAPRV
jgi:fructokinase